MHVLHINSDQDVDKVNKFVDQGSDVFILVYMEGCGPCNATRPEWAKIEYALKDQYAKNNNLVVIDINKDFISDIKYIGDIDGFPTIKYIGNYGKTVEPYEKSSITKKDRSINSFINSFIAFSLPSITSYSIFKSQFSLIETPSVFCGRSFK
jgi:thiol-disulfide isomerase/thioredoxin